MVSQHGLGILKAYYDHLMIIFVFFQKDVIMSKVKIALRSFDLKTILRSLDEARPEVAI
jgi:hypothetical protein